MKQQKLILAIDHGTSGIKTSLVSLQGEVCESTFCPTLTKFIPGGGAIQDPDEWWQAIVQTCHSLLRSHSRPEIAAISVSSTFSTTVAVDKKGQALLPAITWLDTRGGPYIKKIVKGFPQFMGYNLFTAWKWIKKTAGGPTLSGKDDLGHVLFVKYELPQIYEQTFQFLPSKDYLNLKLCGEFAASFDSMTLFWVSNTQDIDKVHYDQDLLSLTGLDQDKLPPIGRSIDILGQTTKETTAQLGLPKRVPVIIGSPDHQCAGLGAGSVLDFVTHLYLGTSSWLQCVVPFKKTDILHSIASLPYAIPGKYYAANEQDMAGGCLDFWIQKFSLTNTPHQRLSYDWAIELAKKSPPLSNDLIFAPWLNGERTPVDDHNLRGMLFNIGKEHTLPDILRSILEGVALNCRWTLHYLEKFLGGEVKDLAMVGGGAKSDFWCQIFANILQRRIKQVVHPQQANARGAAFLASVALEEITFSDIPKLIKYKNVFEPDPELAQVYKRQFAVFRKLYQKNRSLFHKMNPAH